MRSDGVLPPSSTRTPEPRRESISNKACKVLIDLDSLLFILKTVYQSADETTRQMRPAQWFTTVNTHHNPSLNIGTTHSNNQGREEIPPNLEDVNLEDISIDFLCIYSTHPNWKQIVSSRNDYGQTMAHICVTLGYFRLLQHLSTWQIDLNVVDHMGSTALHYAYLFIQEECARLLIHSGAERFILDDLGRSPSSLNPSLEVRVHPNMETGGDSSTHSTPSADFAIEMPKEADGLYAKNFLVQQWTRRIERRSETRGMPQHDVRGHSDTPNTAPNNHSEGDSVGRVIDCQYCCTSTTQYRQYRQVIPTLVAQREMETLSNRAVPSCVLFPPTGTSDQAKVKGPKHTVSHDLDALNAIVQNYKSVGSQRTTARNAFLSSGTGTPLEGRKTLKPVPGTPTTHSHTIQFLKGSLLSRDALRQDTRQLSDFIQNVESSVPHQAPLSEDPCSGPVETATINPSDIVGSSSPSPVPQGGDSLSKHRHASLNAVIPPAELSRLVPQPNTAVKTGTQVDPMDESCGFLSMDRWDEQFLMRKIVVAIRASQFFINNKLEPNLGTPEAAEVVALMPPTPVFWRNYGTKAKSIYSIFIKVDGKVCKCLWCGDVQNSNLQRAIGHFRASHLAHKPFICGDVHDDNKIWRVHSLGRLGVPL